MTESQGPGPDPAPFRARPSPTAQRLTDDVRTADILADIRLAEMSARLPAKFQSTHPGAPWDALRAVRNRIAHDYRSVDGAIIWEVLENRLPDFRRTLGI